ncbi:MAG: metal ABC transporter permease [Fluviicoccus sp.]|uniref:metal ABC transporter permease n=1 Tax=Fluviicoccus sp. TaxID=2003552 RepID=UPI002718C613|nr:metal ABC transporter permease [Fluviicoccus sp.]MDO8332028.1 metal ABC transporter permease [Fluviicoccus sp.]
MWEILWPAWLGGSLAALMAAPLGCLLVWRRLSFFGDSLAHATLLGAGLSLLFHIPVWGGILGVCTLLALMLAGLLNRSRLPSDALLTLLSATTLSAGLIAIRFNPGAPVDLQAWLFGDLLALTPADLPLLAGGTALILGIVAAFWQPFVLATLDERLAAVEGAPVVRLRILLLLLLALAVTLAMKVAGSLLITALLVIPPLAVRPLARQPAAMALLAALAGVLAVSGGLLASFQWDAPVGPSIVLTAAMLFALVHVTAPRSS